MTLTIARGILFLILVNSVSPSPAGAATALPCTIVRCLTGFTCVSDVKEPGCQLVTQDDPIIPVTQQLVHPSCRMHNGSISRIDCLNCICTPGVVRPCSEVVCKTRHFGCLIKGHLLAPGQEFKRNCKTCSCGEQGKLLCIDGCASKHGFSIVLVLAVWTIGTAALFTQRYFSERAECDVELQV
eukprot:TRINITY_DN38230_c0_g1_i1.p1 TRINITY_DN38230_c0_g1~~TRINITY_DN38230_c0_g1_i1.p1  ORF type:complete len:184 (+),score=8.83 TRINITY_DN38230_c0_g1_i1:65-616(+)